jgi:hypothetical protein
MGNTLGKILGYKPATLHLADGRVLQAKLKAGDARRSGTDLCIPKNPHLNMLIPMFWSQRAFVKTTLPEILSVSDPHETARSLLRLTERKRDEILTAVEKRRPETAQAIKVELPIVVAEIAASKPFVRPPSLTGWGPLDVTLSWRELLGFRRKG